MICKRNYYICRKSFIPCNDMQQNQTIEILKMSMVWKSWAFFRNLGCTSWQNEKGMAFYTVHIPHNIDYVVCELFF